VASTKAYTSQIVAITMMALVLSEDAISKRQRRDEIIDSLCQLPGACQDAAGHGCASQVPGVGCWRLEAPCTCSCCLRSGGVLPSRLPRFPQWPPWCFPPADRVRRTRKLNDQIKQLAAELKDEQSCLMFGRGRNYATAMEAALKVRKAWWLGWGRAEVGISAGCAACAGMRHSKQACGLYAVCCLTQPACAPSAPPCR